MRRPVLAVATGLMLALGGLVTPALADACGEQAACFRICSSYGAAAGSAECNSACEPSISACQASRAAPPRLDPEEVPPEEIRPTAPSRRSDPLAGLSCRTTSSGGTICSRTGSDPGSFIYTRGLCDCRDVGGRRVGFCQRPADRDSTVDFVSCWR